MAYLPFGINRLDKLIGGGAPAGSVVLLAGDPGAGAREFMYTSALMNGLAGRGSDRFDLHYGELQPEATVPEDVHWPVPSPSASWPNPSTERPSVSRSANWSSWIWSFRSR
jgi:hypothetical protein